MPTMPPYEGLKSFVSWIKQQKTKHWSKDVILISHGSGDHPMLLNNLAGYNLLQDLSEVVSGFGNTLPILHKSLTKVFHRYFPGEDFEAHNALADAEALFKILMKKYKNFPGKLLIANEEIMKHVLPQDYVLETTKIKVSKAYVSQKSTFVEKRNQQFHFIFALNAYGEIPNVKFDKDPNPDLETKKENEFKDVMDTNGIKYLAIDVQLSEEFSISENDARKPKLRSEIIEISACEIQNAENRFHISCRAYNEPGLELPSVEEGLVKFIKWLTKHNGKCILVGYDMYQMLWPNLLNHLCYFKVQCGKRIFLLIRFYVKSILMNQIGIRLFDKSN